MVILKLIFIKVVFKFKNFINFYKIKLFFNSYFLIINIYVEKKIDLILNFFKFFFSKFINFYFNCKIFFSLQYSLFYDIFIPFLDFWSLYLAELFSIYNFKSKEFTVFLFSYISKKSKFKSLNLNLNFKEELFYNYSILIKFFKKIYGFSKLLIINSRSINFVEKFSKFFVIKIIYNFKSKKIYLILNIKYIYNNMSTSFLYTIFYKYFKRFKTQKYTNKFKNLFNLNVRGTNLKIFSFNHEHFMYKIIHNFVIVVYNTNFSNLKLTKFDEELNYTFILNLYYNMCSLFSNKIFFFLLFLNNNINKYIQEIKRRLRFIKLFFLRQFFKEWAIILYYSKKFYKFYKFCIIYKKKILKSVKIYKKKTIKFLLNYSEWKKETIRQFWFSCWTFAIYLHYIFIDSYTYWYSRIDMVDKLWKHRKRLIYLLMVIPRKFYKKNLKIVYIREYYSHKFNFGMLTFWFAIKKLIFATLRFFLSYLDKKNFINFFFFVIFLCVCVKSAEVISNFYIPNIIFFYNYYSFFIWKILFYIYNYRRYYEQNFKVWKFWAWKKRSFFLKKFFFVNRSWIFIDNYFGRLIREYFRRGRNYRVYRKLKTKFRIFFYKQWKYHRPTHHLRKGKKRTMRRILKFVLRSYWRWTIKDVELYHSVTL